MEKNKALRNPTDPGEAKNGKKEGKSDLSKIKNQDLASEEAFQKRGGKMRNISNPNRQVRVRLGLLGFLYLSGSGYPYLRRALCPRSPAPDVVSFLRNGWPHRIAFDDSFSLH